MPCVSFFSRKTHSRCSTSIRLAGVPSASRVAQVFDLHSLGDRHRLDVLARLLQDAGAVPHRLGLHAEGLGHLNDSSAGTLASP